MRASPGRPPALLGAQLLFNVGFYAVVPFIAVVLTEDFGVGGAAVGLVLGVRTFAQQGMFLVGGALTDRIGARTTILWGCAVRIAGFLALAASLWTEEPRLGLFIGGTVLTGLGGALFSPGLNTLVAEAELARSRADPAPGRRAALFAWLSVTGEVGAVVGPLIGAALLDWGFAAVAGSGAGFFAAISAFLWCALPREPDRRQSARRDPNGRRRHRNRDATRRAPGSPRPGWASLRDRRFAAFAALHAADLLAYNQLYLTLPLELRSIDSAPQLVGLMFAWVSILTIVLQLPIARWCARVGSATALRTGYLTGAAGFLVLATGSAARISPQAHLLAVVLAVSCLTLGHLTVNPTALGLVPGFARGGPTGSYFGLLASCGGVAVLVGNLAAGGLFAFASATPAPSAAAALPWVFIAAPLLLSATLAPRLVRPRV
ncbi:MFS transporter [Leucobacter sp. CSA1]|uniref:MFS transporter n=1 Tax=Leucobacter chromiisoli TaxID=2796471 RepID=A0A934Q9P5_9MICO|nr:MFS transporter [Leucobacter chromiisoli]MBK0419122.1 MFS transporter [Leucobacter chromiisoli]